tara:strand:- start:792 stop:1253 length:462 start_codon:yes stop_codon:yes gene_type:complete
MPKINFPEIWYASEEKFNARFKQIVFDDNGSLEISNINFIFTGKKDNIQINRSNIKNISIINQKINWISYLIVTLILILFSFLMKYNLIVLFFVIIIGWGFGFLINHSTKWIQVEYIDKNNKLKKVYFANGSKNGWSGIFGGTQKIYDSINQK